MSNSRDVVILLATYNGAKFIAAQIDSILKQALSNWNLWIRDDGSTDDTINIIKDYCRKDNRIKLIVDEERNLGACGNFLKLMAEAQRSSVASYFAFADQDDVWKPNKLELLLDEMERIEPHAKGLPILVHSNFSVVSEDLAILKRSHHAKIIDKMGAVCSPNRLLIQNVVTGCTALFNRNLLKKSLPVPEAVVMHDWWLALVAGLFGKIGYVDEPLVLYRQHSSNCLGIEMRNLNKGFSGFFVKLKVALDRKLLTRDLNQTVVMAEVALNSYSGSLDNKQKNLLSIVSGLKQKGFWAKRASIIKYQLFRPYLIGNIAMFLRW